MKKRTDWDFSNHTHTVEIFKSENGKEIRVDHFREGNKRCGYIKFLNDEEGLSVFGDFGNWIFCRPFHPSADGFVSDAYWNEKLKIASSQEHAKFDSDETAKEIEELINGGLEDWGYDGDRLDEAKEWLSDLLEYVDDELDYTYHAYRGYNPTELDYEDIPFCREGSIQLKIIFDAFDEMCNRMKNNKRLDYDNNIR